MFNLYQNYIILGSRVDSKILGSRLDFVILGSHADFVILGSRVDFIILGSHVDFYIIICVLRFEWTCTCKKRCQMSSIKRITIQTGFAKKNHTEAF